MAQIIEDNNSLNKFKTKKEYQAQITSLKKQAKNNKKNKKDILLEIAKLEEEFTELCSEEKCCPKDVEDNIGEPQVQNQKVSRAQKRRDKKVMNEKERLKRIEDQEELNKQGARHKELTALKSILKCRDLKVFEIPSDGDCLYKAIEHQLTLNDKPSVATSELRRLTSCYIRENKMEFLPFMSNADGEPLDETEFEEYCSNIENTNAWGGQIELKALSSILKTTIEVLQADSPPTIQGEEFSTKPLILTYHRHVLGLGEHYNSTQPSLDSDSELSE
uniref:Putative otu ovarian tumor-like cysteine protease n=1 Tax=Xenopsylla cheopis TaxID=163159 RepID=A0A6M2DYQ4_XENCH